MHYKYNTFFQNGNKNVKKIYKKCFSISKIIIQDKTQEMAQLLYLIDLMKLKSLEISLISLVYNYFKLIIYLKSSVLAI